MLISINFISRATLYSWINLCAGLSIAIPAIPVQAESTVGIVKEAQKELAAQEQHKAVIAKAQNLVSDLGALSSNNKEIISEIKKLIAVAQSSLTKVQDLRDQLINAQDLAKESALSTKLAEHNIEVKIIMDKLEALTKTFPG